MSANSASRHVAFAGTQGLPWSELADAPGTRRAQPRSPRGDAIACLADRRGSPQLDEFVQTLTGPRIRPSPQTQQLASAFSPTASTAQSRTTLSSAATDRRLGQRGLPRAARADEPPFKTAARVKLAT